jgi:hypothetical protein
MMEAMPDEEKYWFTSSVRFTKCSGFHKPGVVYGVRRTPFILFSFI